MDRERPAYKLPDHYSSNQQEPHRPNVSSTNQGARLGSNSTGQAGSSPRFSPKTTSSINIPPLPRPPLWQDPNRPSGSATVENSRETKEGMDKSIDEAQRANHAVEQLPLVRSKFREKEASFSKMIHILGTGTTGSFIAHSLLGSTSPPPVTILLHNRLLMQQWHDGGRMVRLIKDDMIDSKSGLNVEFSASPDDYVRIRRDLESDNNSRHGTRQPPSIIENLIVTTEGHATVAALSAIKHRLRGYSTICFIQDGLGIIDHINSLVFPRAENRPSYILGSSSHDLQMLDPKFTVRQRRPGTLSLTIIPARRDGSSVRRIDFGWKLRTRYLMRTLFAAPGLEALGYLPQEFHKMQLQRLAITSILGPLSVVYQCTNDQLLHNYQVSRTMKLLIKEISLVLPQLPEVSRIPGISEHFSPERLEEVLLSVIGKTGRNRTSMLQAVTDGRKTNIDFHNGYLIDRAASLGIDCPNLELMAGLVKGKQTMMNRERNSYIPFTY